MRELKFRAWDKLNSEMLEVYKIDLLFNKSVVFQYEDSLAFQHVELMEYTGIHDNSEDEKEIYEGDIIKFIYDDDNYIGVVKFEAGAFILSCDSLGDSYITMIEIIDCDRDYWWISGNIIGNIYENPELIPRDLNCVNCKYYLCNHDEKPCISCDENTNDGFVPMEGDRNSEGD